MEVTIGMTVMWLVYGCLALPIWIRVHGLRRTQATCPLWLSLVLVVASLVVAAAVAVALEVTLATDDVVYCICNNGDRLRCQGSNHFYEDVRWAHVFTVLGLLWVWFNSEIHGVLGRAPRFGPELLALGVALFGWLTVRGPVPYTFL